MEEKNKDLIENIIKIKNLTKYEQKRAVLENIDIEFSSKNIVGFLGNSSGKLESGFVPKDCIITLLNCVSHNIHNYEGEILLNGKTSYSKVEDICIVPSAIKIPKNNTVRKIINVFKQFNPNYDEKYIISKVEELNLSLDLKIRKFTPDEQSVIQFLLLAANKPKFLLFENLSCNIFVIDFMQKEIKDLNDLGMGILINARIIQDVESILDEIIIFKYSDQYVREYTQDIINLQEYIKNMNIDLSTDTDKNIENEVEQ